MNNQQFCFTRIFHPSDFSEASDVAFCHALRLAVAGQGRLTILHTGTQNGYAQWDRFPAVRQRLEQWGVLPVHSRRADVQKIGLDIARITTPHSDPESGILHYLHRHPHDLIVLATHQYTGLARLAHKTIAETVARRAGEMTLFVPHDINGFVAQQSGGVQLHNVLIPVDQVPEPQAAIDAAVTLLNTLGVPEAMFTLLHVGADSTYPRVRVPEANGWQWQKLTRQGNVEEQILQTAAELQADLIVMTTIGHHGFLDALRGSTTERVVRHARCPVLAVPRGKLPQEAWLKAPVWSPAQ